MEQITTQEPARALAGGVPVTPPSVLIVDDHEAFCTSLAASFRGLDWEARVVPDHATARVACLERQPALIVTELRIGPTWAFQVVEAYRSFSPSSRVAIATAYPSVATAVRAVRLGFEGYFSKPVLARDIVEMVFETPPADSEAVEVGTCWPTLNRTIWEYLNQVFVAAGTMSEAARRLGIDRRSLRRMLARYPPAR
jgi:two-component system, response regulator RegA